MQVGSIPIQFVVQPNSVWLGYRIKDSTEVEKRIPTNLDLTKVSVFGNIPEYYLFFNFFHVSSNVLSGLRLEIVTMVREKSTGMHRFIILDYLTNTVSSDPNIPFQRANQKNMQLLDLGSHLFLNANNDYVVLLKKGKKKSILKTFVNEPNKKIYYAKSEIPNQLEFDINQVSDTHDIEILHSKNHLWREVINEKIEIQFFYPNQTIFSIIPHGNS